MENNADLTNNDLIGICMDFFEAGGETVGSTLSWVMMYLARYPDVQEKCYLELQSVVGKK
jgi:cytochrome P450